MYFCNDDKPKTRTHISVAHWQPCTEKIGKYVLEFQLKLSWLILRGYYMLSAAEG